jgi:hypothetical protein
MEINGNQCTIVWHVDDLKISHADHSIVTAIIETLNQCYGQLKPLTVTRGKLHEYLGIQLDYSVLGKVAIRMQDYIRKVIEEAPDDMDGTTATPAAYNLFDVDKNGVPLSNYKAELFHYFTAKLLFLCKRARPDIQTALAFLCTRVKAPDQHDYKKLARVIRYLRGTATLHLTLQIDKVTAIKWYVDASFAVHHDMRSHTGSVMIMGKGAIYSASTKQKLNTTSSTEGELVGVTDTLGQILWTRYFMDAQGYNVGTVPIMQDNRSAMLLENNGIRSSGKKTLHIIIWYFCVQDRIASGEVQVEHWPCHRHDC